MLNGTASSRSGEEVRTFPEVTPYLAHVAWSQLSVFLLSDGVPQDSAVGGDKMLVRLCSSAMEHHTIDSVIVSICTEVFQVGKPRSKESCTS